MRKLDKTAIKNHLMSMREKKVLLEPSGEEKAFVYQQALELSPLLNQNEPIAVILEKNNNKNSSTYSVTFILIPETLNIKVQSEGDNLFDVCISAKNKAKKTIQLLANQADSPTRKIQMAHFKMFPYLQ